MGQTCFTYHKNCELLMKGYSMVDGNSHLLDIDGSGELDCPPSLVVVFELFSGGAGFEVAVNGKCSITACEC